MAGGQIVTLERTPEVASLYADNRIRLRIERLAATKHFDCDRIGLDAIATALQRLLHHMGKEAALAPGRLEVRTGDDQGKLGAASLKGQSMLPECGRSPLGHRSLT